MNKCYRENNMSVLKNKIGNCLIQVAMVLVLNIFEVCGHVKNKELIYMLDWMPLNIHEPIDFLELEQKSFFNHQCPYQNCFLADNSSYFPDLTEFDVILFNVINLRTGMELPKLRSIKQRYVLFGMEHLGYCPLSTLYNGFFNLTWTYKLPSDSPFPYIAIRNKLGHVIGPQENMHWMNMDEMKPTSKYVKRKIHNKNIAAAWIVSHCDTVNRRYEFVEELQKHLAGFNHSVDIYGRCGKTLCPLNEGMNECYALIETDYYFYLSFENSFHSDYVTEKLLHALKHYAVPVVYGGANYTRFMPDGMYLNARELGPESLAKEMNEIIKDKRRYYNFFKWKRYYSFHETSEGAYTNELCRFCAMLNELKQRNVTKVYKDIANWWNGPQDVQDTCMDFRPVLPNRTRDRS